MKATDIIPVRKVKCPWCNGTGQIFSEVRSMESSTHIVLVPEPCSNCGGYGFDVKPRKPRPLSTRKKVGNQTATTPDSYRPCPKCGQKVGVLLRADGSYFIGDHLEPTSTPPRICLGMVVEGLLKKEPRSVRFQRDLKAKRRLEAAIKKHDKQALRNLANPPLLQPEFQIRGKNLVSHSIFDMLDRPKK